jgi:hypothetical protein
VTPESIIRRQFPHHADVATAPQLGSQDELPKFNDVEVLRALFARVAQNHRVRMVWIWVQIVANLLSLALYVWSTYVTDKSNLWVGAVPKSCSPSHDFMLLQLTIDSAKSHTFNHISWKSH